MYWALLASLPKLHEVVPLVGAMVGGHPRTANKPHYCENSTDSDSLGVGKRYNLPSAAETSCRRHGTYCDAKGMSGCLLVQDTNT